MKRLFPIFSQSNKVYTPHDVDEMLESVRHEINIISRGKIDYLNASCAFDTETTSFFDNGEKKAIVYVWMIGINGRVCMGRTWDELGYVVNMIVNKFNLNVNRRLICFVHNLAYDFQFFNLWFKFDKVFAMDNRKPLYAIAECGIEFRCSYLQSGYSLATIGKNLTKYKVEKKVGDLDYSLKRNSLTPLTEREKGYCVNDVLVVMAYICETAEKDGGLLNMPLTKTGYVRKYCRAKCFESRLAYSRLMRELTIEPLEYSMLKHAFAGGFTHGNPLRSMMIHYNVTSFDFNSSYPGVLIAEQYPMSKGEFITITSIEEFEDTIKYYACVFDVIFEGIEPRLFYDNYISYNKCWIKEGVILNNGRIAYADRIGITITDVDYKIIINFYKIKSIKIGRCIRYKRDYLPTKFVQSILDLYSKKTKLKGVEGMEEEYLVSKEMLNSCYGMCVTSIAKDEYIYADGWLDEPKKVNIDDAMEEYNNNNNRFLSYVWGVYVTAYARANLFTGIMEFGDDYIYSDTDSVKVLNAKNHMEYIEKYNENQRRKLYRACKIHGISTDMVEPVAPNGKKKLLGAWDLDGEYRMFKTLGAKRYLVQYKGGKKDGQIEMTVAGLNKKIALEYMRKKYGKRSNMKTIDRMTHEPHIFDKINAIRIFNAFDDDLYIPPGQTGKKTHTYIDKEIEGYITDYKGNTAKYHELSFVHLDDADYNLSISSDYLETIDLLRLKSLNV